MEIFNAKISKLKMESDNNVAGDVFIAKPEKDLINRLGVLFGIIELSALPDNFSEHFFDIIGDLKTEYYLPPYELEYGIEKRFEECLGRANRRISRSLSNSVEPIGLDKINVLVGLIYKNKIYLSQIGRNKALLYHQKKNYGQMIIDIFAQASDRRSRPDAERMFSNIISGEITNKDNLIFSNEKVFECLSINEVGEIISAGTPTAAVTEIDEIIKSQSGSNNNFYLVIAQPENWFRENPYATTLAAETEKNANDNIPSENSIKKLLNTQEKTERYLAPSLMPNWKKIIVISLSGLKKAIFYLAKIIKRYTVLAASWLSLKIKQLFSKKSKQPLTGNQQSGATNKISTPTAPSLPPASVLPSIEEEPRAKEIPVEKVSVGAVKLQAGIISGKEKKSWGVRISDWLNDKITIFLKLKKIQQIILVAGFIALFLFSQSIVWMGRSMENGASNINTPQVAKDIEDKINAAEAQNIFNDEAGALKSLNDARNLLKTIPDKNQFKKIKADLTAKIDNLSNELQKIIYLENPQVVIDLTKNNTNIQASGLAINGKTALIFDNGTKSLKQINLDSGLATSSSINAISQARKMSWLNNQNLLILNGDKDLYQYDLSKKTTQLIYSSPEKIDDFYIYEGKVYTLKTSKNQVFKHAIVSGKLNSGTAWIKDNSDIKNGRAIAVEGGLILIKNNNEIKYFNQGKAEATAWIKVDPELKEAKESLSNPQSNYFFVLDPANKRVIAYDKKGGVKQQFTSKTLNNLSNIFLVEKEKKLYLLADNKVYLIPFNF